MTPESPSASSDTISVTERRSAAPISKVESHISDRCSHFPGYRFVVPRKAIRFSVNTALNKRGLIAKICRHKRFPPWRIYGQFFDFFFALRSKVIVLTLIFSRKIPRYRKDREKSEGYTRNWNKLLIQLLCIMGSYCLAVTQASHCSEFRRSTNCLIPNSQFPMPCKS